MEPYIFRVREPITLCGRHLLAGDRVVVRPGHGVFPLLLAPPNYGAVLHAAESGAIELLSSPVPRPAFAVAVGMEPPSSSPPRRSRRLLGRRLVRARLGVVR